jgi:hypothetical protein
MDEKIFDDLKILFKFKLFQSLEFLMKRFVSLLILGSLGACATLPDKQRTEYLSTSIPFTIFDNRILVPVIIDGNGLDPGTPRRPRVTIPRGKPRGLGVQAPANPYACASGIAPLGRSLLQRLFLHASRYSASPSPQSLLPLCFVQNRMDSTSELTRKFVLDKEIS